MPKAEEVIVRASRDEDIQAITAIYSHYVRTSTATFEIGEPDAVEMSRRRRAVLERGLPYVVAEVNGTVCGYAYAGLYRVRRAYRFTVEDSIYVDNNFGRRGVGRSLLSAVISACTTAGYRQMVAVIGGSDNRGSIALHRSLGFEPAGVLRSAGFKFGRWVDSVLMQRPLGDGDNSLPSDAGS